MTQVGIIGIGNIGSALINGLQGKCNLWANDKNAEKIRKASTSNADLNLPGSNTQVIKSSDIICICVRASQVYTFLYDHQSELAGKHILFFQAGIELSSVIESLDAVSINRVICNVNVGINEGILVLLQNSETSHSNMIKDFLSALGKVFVVDNEAKLERWSLIPGCSPALVGLLCEELLKMGKSMGISEDILPEFVYTTLAGSVHNIAQNKLNALAYSESIASSGGMVEDALRDELKNRRIEIAVGNFFKKIAD